MKGYKLLVALTLGLRMKDERAQAAGVINIAGEGGGGGALE